MIGRTAALFLVLLTCLTAQDKVKNIIILIGDGMGLNAVSLEFLKDQNSPYYSFPFTGLSVTTSADKLITDSAAGATAISTGTKTKNGYVGVGPSGTRLKTVFEYADDAGKSTGLAVTSTITHATPGAFFGHVSDRGKQDVLAVDLLNSSVDVAIGSGSSYFIPASAGGRRTDNRNIISELRAKGYYITTTYADLVSTEVNDKLVAFLDSVELPSAKERGFSLGDLTGMAIHKLNTNKNGFVLMVEGSQIDWYAHDNDTVKIFQEMEDFTSAVRRALEFAKKDGRTLVIVTADHETGGLAVNKGNFTDPAYTLRYTTKSHTAGAVPVFAFGPGSSNFTGLYHNDELGKRIIRLIKTEKLKIKNY